MNDLRTLMQAIGARPILDGNAQIEDLHTDSRQVRKGSLFLARIGAAVDGHAYLRASVERGAAAVLVTRQDAVPHDLGVPAFCVDKQDPAYGLLAAEFFDHPTRALNVYGVTGTNGKSSTVWMIDHLLRSLARRPALISTLMYRVGDTTYPAPNTTPDAVVIQRLAREALRAGDTDLVMEISSHGIASGRIAGVQFRAGGWTNFGRDHLDFHGSEDAYFRAKALFFSLYLRQQSTPADAVMIDGPQRETLMHALKSAPDYDAALTHLRALEQPNIPSPACTVVSLGENTPQDVHITTRGASTVRGTPIHVREAHAEAEGFVPVAGQFQVENAALAMTMVQRVERTAWPTLLEAIQSFAGVPGRLERVADPEENEPAVFVDYAHTPDAVRAVLQTARDLTEGRLSVVVGCGGDRDRGKRPQMAAAALEIADHSVFTTDNPRTEDPDVILDDMCAELTPSSRWTRVRARRDAIAQGIDDAAHGVCIIAGKGHEDYQEIQKKRWFWSDAEEARAAIAQRRYGHDRPRRLSGWSPERLAAITGGSWQNPPPRSVWNGLSTDTRTIARGDIFVALKGPRFDAHDHLGDALERGAAAAIVERHVPESTLPQLIVSSPYNALANIARALVQEARASETGLHVIAITGSNGKTTTRTFAAALSALRHGASPLATHGNFNNQIGLPLSVAPLSRTHRHAILEMGANQPGDIRDLVQMAPPDVAVLTSIAPSHLEGFGSSDGIRTAKAEMIRDASPAAVVMPYRESLGIWGDAARARGAHIFTFGSEEEASVRCVRNHPLGPVRIVGQKVWRDLDIDVRVPVPGRHNAGNFAAALLATSLKDGVLMAPPTPAQLDAFADRCVAEPGRLEYAVVAGRHVIYDAYNANPGSVRAALDVLDAFSAPRIAVLGELLELGDQEEIYHRDVLRDAAERCEIVITIGRRWPVLDAPHVHRCLERTEAVARVVHFAQENATVLWKGSRGVRLELAREEVESIWTQEE